MIRIHYVDHGEVLNLAQYADDAARMQPALDANHTGDCREQLGWLDVQRRGGRCSLFTPVGLLPIAVAGGNIDELIRGAADAQVNFDAHGPLARHVREYALRRNDLDRQGFDVEAAVFFEPCLNALGMWWRHLFGESEGEDGRGIFPTVMVNTEALRSQGQYMQSGKRHVAENFIHVREPLDDMLVGKGCGMADGFDYLDGRTFNDLNLAAYTATVTAHSQGGVPCHVVELERMDEYHPGLCMYAMMRACYESSPLLGFVSLISPVWKHTKQKCSK